MKKTKDKTIKCNYYKNWNIIFKKWNFGRKKKTFFTSHRNFLAFLKQCFLQIFQWLMVYFLVSEVLQQTEPKSILRIFSFLLQFSPFIATVRYFLVVISLVSRVFLDFQKYFSFNFCIADTLSFFSFHNFVPILYYIFHRNKIDNLNLLQTFRISDSEFSLALPCNMIHKTDFLI